MRNCAVLHTENIPLTRELLEDATTGTIFAYTVTCACCLLTWILFGVEFVRALQEQPWRSSKWVVRHLLILLLFPVTASCYFIAALIPRSIIFTEFIASCYLAFVIMQFFFLVVSYLGGEEQLLKKLDGEEMRVPPCCTCDCCKGKFSKQLLWKIRLYALQYSILQPVIGFLGNVLAADGQYNPGDLSPTGSFLYLKLIGAVSTILAISSMMRFNALAKDFVEDRFRCTAKFYAMWTVLLLTGLQMVLFSALGEAGLWHCTHNVRLTTLNAWFNSFAVVMEMAVLHALTHIYAFPKHTPLDKPKGRARSTTPSETVSVHLTEPERVSESAPLLNSG